MQIFKEINKIQYEIKSLKAGGNKIAFIPTMGSLHKGHLSLIKEARKQADKVIVSIFVNKEQFNEVQDFDNYPNNISQDIKKLEDSAVDILFYPTAKEINNFNDNINFEIGELGNNLCGRTRQGHFEGVVWVVNKLLKIINPDIAIFGEKDFQQSQIIKKLVKDLNLNIKIITKSTFREDNGLAMSSRNKNLSIEDLDKASNLYKILSIMKQDIMGSKINNLDDILSKSQLELLKYFDQIDYLEICSEENLQIIKNFDKNIKSRIFVAVYLNQVRLIDNIKLI